LRSRAFRGLNAGRPLPVPEPRAWKLLRKSSRVVTGDAFFRAFFYSTVTLSAHDVPKPSSLTGRQNKAFVILSPLIAEIGTHQALTGSAEVNKTHLFCPRRIVRRIEDCGRGHEMRIHYVSRGLESDRVRELTTLFALLLRPTAHCVLRRRRWRWRPCSRLRKTCKGPFVHLCLCLSPSSIADRFRVSYEEPIKHPHPSLYGYLCDRMAPLGRSCAGLAFKEQVSGSADPCACARSKVFVTRVAPLLRTMLTIGKDGIHDTQVPHWRPSLVPPQSCYLEG
jgi:hypothetical protein